MWFTVAFATEDWTQAPPLSAAPADLLAAVPPAGDRDVTVLLEEVELALAPGGLATTRWRTVYAVHTRAGVDAWGVAAATWSPWFEDRPVIQARVVAPDGSVHGLDPAHLSEAPGPAGEVLDDDRALRAPLAGLAPGAVVEEVVTLGRHAPYFPAGEVWAFPLARPTVPERRRIRVSAPPGVPFTWTAPPALPVVEAREAGRRVLSVEIGARAAPAPEPDQPPDVPWDALVVSTARDWRSVAAAYLPLVEAALAEVDLRDLAARVRGDAVGRDEIVARMLAEVRRLRYVPVEFGATGITPRSPAIALRNGYGDCKDKALLLVGLLRASGIEAHVALVRNGPGLDVAPLPGLDFFDHQIVVVPGPAPLWIDPTSDHTPLGRLPLPDQGRRALVVAKDTRGLATTPVEPSSASEWRVDWEVTFTRDGAAQASEVLTTSGWLADHARAAHADRSPAELESFYARRAGAELAGRLVGPVAVTDDGGDRFVVATEVRDLGRAGAGPDGARFVWSGWDVLGELPPWIRSPRPPEEAPRSAPVQLLPHRGVQVVRVRPPPDHAADQLPAPFEHQIGPVLWRQAVAVEADGAVRVETSFDTGDGRLTAAQAELLRARIGAYAASDMHAVELADAAVTAWGAGRRAEALQLARGRVVDTPGDARRARAYGSLLLEAGFGDAARAELDRALALAPGDPDTLRARGSARLHDGFGRFLGAGFDRTGAIADLEAAVARSPRDAAAWMWLAAAHEVGVDGVLDGPGSSPDGAIRALEARRALGLLDLDANLARHLLRAGRLDALDALLPTLAPDAGPTAFRIAAAAARGGVAAALAVPVGRGARDERVTGLAMGAAALLARRAYADAAALLEAAGAASPDPVAFAPIVALARGAVRREDDPLDPRDPAAVARAFLLDALRDPAEARATWGGRAFADRPAPTGGAPLSLLGVALPPDVGAELLAGETRCALDPGGDPSGWRATCRVGDGALRVYLAEERGRPRVIATGDDLPALAAAVDDLPDEEGRDRCAAWLAAELAVGDPAGRSPASALLALDPRLGAAAVGATSRYDAEAALAVLERGADRAPGEASAVDRARLAALASLGRWSQVPAVVARLLAARPDDPEPLRALADAVEGGADADAAVALARSAVADRTDPAALAALATVEGRAGRDADALATWRRAVAAGLEDPVALNDAAWAALADPAARAEGLGWARRATEATGWSAPHVLHTLAVHLLEAGQPEEARSLLVEASRAASLSPGWVYVQARLAAAWGLPEVAAERCGRVGPPPEGPHVIEVEDLAARWCPAGRR